MNSTRPITIVGGGLAGLTLGIGLRQRSVPAVVWESGGYPRHRVCGEFISGRGLNVLGELGLRGLLEESGIYWAKTTAFFTEKRLMATRPLPEPALCISRRVLDTTLARHFQELGGELLENHRWKSGFEGEGVVRASGRRIQPVVDGWRWFGLKVHANQVELEADLELHLTPGGYIGLCQLDQGVVNVCGLFRSRTAQPRLHENWKQWLAGVPGSPLDRKLSNAIFDESVFCSVAGILLKPVRARELKECALGDSLTMIPPLTGNGMSVAFETAQLAIDPLVDYASRQVDWGEARRMVADRCDRQLKRRLFWANLLQHGFFHPVLRWLWLSSGGHWNPLWRFLFRSTR